MPPTAPAAARQPGPPRFAHRCILADADAARCLAHHLAKAEFATLRLRLLKLGACVIETVLRIRLGFAAACPEAGLFRLVATNLQPAAP
ncbi:transposase [Mesorhizobium atlanticum]|uniref:transposase n=1 Tax=Mesorhizobium atlanticum TaxID=2233532 RepID=UPI00247A0E57|nr:transposase [Mesorhizobium atlanticum]